MTENWGKWKICKNKPNLKGFQLSDTKIFRLGLTVIVVDYYDKGRWDPEGEEVRVIKEFTEEEWEKYEKLLRNAGRGSNGTDLENTLQKTTY